MRITRDQVVFYCILLMIAMMFISRAALSMAMVLFLVVTLANKEIPGTVRNFFSSPVLWSLSLVFLVPLLSGLWSSDTDGWLSAVRIKLPLLLLPVGFASSFNFSRLQWRDLGMVFLVIILAGTIFTMYNYLQDAQSAHDLYLRSQTLATLLENDHVRFSWLAALAILISLWLFRSFKSSLAKWLIGINMVWLAIFIHILAARTGIVALYTIILFMVIWLIRKKTGPVFTISLFLFLLITPVVAYYTLPTFQNRLKFVYYDYGFFRDGHYLPGGNDATRLISFKAGAEILENNPVLGTGFGDIRGETDSWYARNFPEIPQKERILPSNEWLIYGAGSGIIGFMVFTIALLIPFFIKIKNRLTWILVNILLVFPLLYDIGLEVQFGIFIHCLTLLVFWKWNTSVEKD